MRVLAIGVGGAGCRIANALYANDRKSSKVACVQALAVDIDHDTIEQLQALPEKAKICFMDLDAEVSPGESGARPATIDIGEVVARIQNRESGETDAILVCCGLGGTLTDIVPHLISALRTSVTEPIFGLVTLPALSEGEKRSAKAADDIENIAPLLDATILFDNETWTKKVAARRDELVAEIAKGPGLFGLGRNVPKLSPQEVTYKLLNQNIIRRISLILRAGEFRADGGIDLAEVVMDSSEVLNTMTGMGFVTIGYAVEQLPKNPLSFFSRLRPGDDTEEQRKSAERIIELAKRAIYQEVSIPCDMTSAAKALVLVAGPSHEISMKGFMTVRKWIDRSIAGMETRSGDYPVTNSKFVAIIVVLSGLENIPRISEIKQIREQYRSGGSRSGNDVLDLPAAGPRGSGSRSAITVVWSGEEMKDEMLRLTTPKRNTAGHSPLLPDEEALPDPYDGLPDVLIPPEESPAKARPSPAREIPAIEEEDLPQKTRAPAPRVQPSPPQRREAESSRRPVPARTAESFPPSPGSRTPVKKTLESEYERLPALKHPPVKSRTPENIRLEQELLKRQKSGQPAHKTHEVSTKVVLRGQASPAPETKVLIRKVTTKGQEKQAVPGTEASATVEKKIIRIKRKEPKAEEPSGYDTQDTRSGPSRQEELEVPPEPENEPTGVLSDEELVEIRERPRQARDDIFFGKAVSQKSTLQTKDRALIHTDIKKKKGGDLPSQDDEPAPHDKGGNPVKGKTKPPRSPDDMFS